MSAILHGEHHAVTDESHADVVVCGAGLAGLCAAIAAARHGASVTLIGERPVLGGCSSSEIRVSPQGAAHFHGYARESGILAELIIADRLVNHAETGGTGWTNSVWDLVLYDLVQRTPGVSLLLNTTVLGVETDGASITAVRARTLSAERDLRISGTFFVDATGDGVVAAMAGNPWRLGAESRHEFDEPHAPAEASEGVQGTSIQIMTQDMGRPVPFTAPAWAEHYDDDRFFYEGGRLPDTTRSGWWWLELGIPWHTIHDNEMIRHELTRRTLGVWDWVKNRSPEYRERFENLALDWIGQVPGKRESRRVVGRHMLTEHDLRRSGADAFQDEVAYGGWNIDLHTPGGLLAPISEPTAAEGYRQDASTSVAAHVSPFGIPLRSLTASDLANLFLAGRDVSATHVALGSVRVQGTTSMMGQAVGTAAALLLAGDPDGRREIGELTADQLVLVQQALLRDGVFLPHVRAEDPNDLVRGSAVLTASSAAENTGMGPDDRTFDVDYIGPAEFASGSSDPARDELVRGRSQWIAVEAGPDARGVAAIDLWLHNTTDTAANLDVALRQVSGIWDYDLTTPALRTATLTVPAGAPGWVQWQVDLEAPAGDGSAYLRVDASAGPGIAWPRADGVLPGCLAAVRVSDDGLQRLAHGVTLCHSIHPSQRVWAATEVASGVARPADASNQWRSATADGAAWLRAEWDRPVEIGEVVLQWCGHLLRDYDQLPAMQADPETVRDYTVQIRDDAAGHDDAWIDVVQVTGNVQTHRVHALERRVRTTGLRVRMTATNGADYASLYELRAYSAAREDQRTASSSPLM